MSQAFPNDFPSPYVRAHHGREMYVHMLFSVARLLFRRRTAAADRVSSHATRYIVKTFRHGVSALFAARRTAR